MGINMTIEQFRNDLITLLNSSHLPVGVALYIFKDVYYSLSQKYMEALQDESKAPAGETYEINITPEGESTITAVEE